MECWFHQQTGGAALSYTNTSDFLADLNLALVTVDPQLIAKFNDITTAYCNMTQR